MHAQSQIQRNLNQIYASTNGHCNLPANTPISGAVRTDRNQLSNKQIAQRYLKSVEKNADIDINKDGVRNAAAQPRIIQKEKQSFDFFGPINAGIGKFCKSLDKALSGFGPMLVNGDVSADEQLTRCYYTPSIAWLQVKADDYRLSVQLVGDISPASNCIGDVPVFIDAEPGQASKLLPDYRVNSEQVSVLDFTGSAAVSKLCNTTEDLSCVIPNEGGDINVQIDSVLDTTNDAYIYLSKEQMDNWLASRKRGNETNNLRYIRISPKVNDGMPRSTLGGIISASIIGTGVLLAGGVFLRGRCRAGDASNTLETTVNIMNIATVSSSSSSESSSEVV